MLPVAIVHGSLPILWSLLLQYGAKASSLHRIWNLNSCIIKESFRKVHIQSKIICNRSSSNNYLITYNKKHSQGFLIHETFVIPTMITKEKSLIRGINHNCIFSETFFIQII